VQKWKAHEVVTTGSPERSGFPCAVVLTGSFVLAPETGLVVSVGRAMRSIIATLISASGYQAHTTSPSAIRGFVKRRRSRPSPPAPNVRDDRDTPLLRVRDGANV
jgi:hypothetical protein